MSLASGSFWPKAAISPNLQVPARIFCMGWVFCTYRKLIYRKPELGGDFRSLSPPCPTELRLTQHVKPNHLNSYLILSYRGDRRQDSAPALCVFWRISTGRESPLISENH